MEYDLGGASAAAALTSPLHWSAQGSASAPSIWALFRALLRNPILPPPPARPLGSESFDHLQIPFSFLPPLPPWF